MLSVVVPIYNEEENIHAFHQAVTAAMESVHEAWEIVYVNDGSRDSSLALLLDIQKQDPRVAVVEFSRNFGHQPALTAGERETALAELAGLQDKLAVLQGDAPLILPAVDEAAVASVVQDGPSRRDRGALPVAVAA